MKFYDCKTAPSPRRVRVFAAEKQIELDTVQVDLAAGEQFSDAYRRINPDCTVPTLELDDGTRISEVSAICLYLEAIVPAPALFGNDDRQRALTVMWNAKAEQQGLGACADALRNHAKGLQGRALPGPKGYEQIPELAQRGRDRAAAFMRRMDSQLREQAFLAGDDYSIADITGMIFIDFAKRLKIPVADELDRLQQWYAAVSTRPSAAA